MNRIKTVNEIVTLLEAEYTGENIYPEHEVENKVKPCLLVVCTSEDIHETIVGASELEIEFINEINDEDGGGVAFATLTAFVCNDDFKADLTASGEITCHRVELSSTELERENTTSKQTLTVKMWVYS